MKEAVEQDQTVSLNSLCEIAGICRSTCQRILHDDLALHSVCARWVPHTLNANQKNQRVNGAQRILDELDGSVVVIDEKWLYAEERTNV